MVEATVKLAMVIGLQIQGVLRFVLSQTDGVPAADLLRGPKLFCAREVSGWKSWAVTPSRILGPSMGCFFVGAYGETREWAVVSSEP
jgi:hypothetical protein